MRILLTILASFLALTVLASQDHKLFLEGKKAANRGKWDEMAQIQSQLNDHPLKPYLEYYYINRNIKTLEDTVMFEFLNQYPKSPLAAKLRRKWLGILANEKAWDKYLSVYQPTERVSTQCDYLLALHQTGKQSQAYAQLETIYLTDDEHPENCIPLFDSWLKSLSNKDDIIWQRFELALKAKNMELAKSISNKLSGTKKTEAKQILQVYRSHNLVTKKSFMKKKPSAEVVSYGVKRLARANPQAAVDAYNRLKKLYQFTPDQEQRMFEQIGLTMTMRKNKNATTWYRKVVGRQLDDVFLEWMVRAGLLFSDWQLVIETVDSLPQHQRQSSRWQYWYARALAKLGKKEQAHAIFDRLDDERSYHGFLASLHTENNINVNHRELTVSAADIEEVKTSPGFVRAKILRDLNLDHEARLELFYLMKHGNEKQQYIVTKLVSEWGWHPQALRLSRHSEHKDDIHIRFPLVHQDDIAANAELRELNPALVFALIRQESYFMPYVSSHAGAIGLMQLMPKTARQTAKQFSIKLSSIEELKNGPKNIKLGSAHLSRLLDQLNENPILAIAAYNAGKRAVTRWLPKDEPIEADIWIETVPYHETRNYLKNVIAYYMVYQHRLGQTPNLDEIMQDIKAEKNK